jgi:hypothetical protein
MEEKVGVSKLETIDTGEYDPDAGLSDEERARIVMFIQFLIILKTHQLTECDHRTEPSSAN